MKAVMKIKLKQQKHKRNRSGGLTLFFMNNMV